VTSLLNYKEKEETRKDYKVYVCILTGGIITVLRIMEEVQCRKVQCVSAVSLSVLKRGSCITPLL